MSTDKSTTENRVSKSAKILCGQLAEYGKAPFEFKADAKDSFFVTLSDPAGNKTTHWGVDLERALEEADCKLGEEIRLKRLGQQDVQISDPIKDDAGKITGHVERTVKRNKWTAELVRAENDAAPAETTMQTEQEAPAYEVPNEEAANAQDARPLKNPINLSAVNQALSMFKSRVDEQGAQVFSATRWLRSVSFTDIPPAVLKTTSNDSLVAEGMVAQALSRGWNPINTSGTPEFQANVFYHAVRMGAQVANYTPTATDLALLAKTNTPIPDWVPTNQLSPAAMPATSAKPRRAAPGMGM